MSCLLPAFSHLVHHSKELDRETIFADTSVAHGRRVTLSRSSGIFSLYPSNDWDQDVTREDNLPNLGILPCLSVDQYTI